MSRGKNVRGYVRVLLIVVGLVLCTSSVSATIVSPSNGSFEAQSFIDDGNGTPGFTGQLLPTDWAWSPNANANPTLHHPLVTGIYPAAADGTTIVGLEGQEVSWGGGVTVQGVQQDLGTMVSGDKYAFSATLSSDRFANSCIYRISFFNVTDNRELAAITQATFDPSAFGALHTMAASFSYTATTADSGDTMRLIMESGPDLGPWKEFGTIGYVRCSRTGVDAVTVTTSAIPEPATMVLVFTGLFGLLAYAWRKRK